MSPLARPCHSAPSGPVLVNAAVTGSEAACPAPVKLSVALLPAGAGWWRVTNTPPDAQAMVSMADPARGP